MPGVARSLQASCVMIGPVLRDRPFFVARLAAGEALFGQTRRRAQRSGAVPNAGAARSAGGGDRASRRGRLSSVIETGSVIRSTSRQGYYSYILAVARPNRRPVIRSGRFVACGQFSAVSPFCGVRRRSGRATQAGRLGAAAWPLATLGNVSPLTGSCARDPPQDCLLHICTHIHRPPRSRRERSGSGSKRKGRGACPLSTRAAGATD